MSNVCVRINQYKYVVICAPSSPASFARFIKTIDYIHENRKQNTINIKVYK